MGSRKAKVSEIAWHEDHGIPNNITFKTSPMVFANVFARYTRYLLAHMATVLMASLNLNFVNL